MARVFISHASEDREPVDEVYRWLAEDHEVFLDRDLRNGIVVGEEWEQRLSERLSERLRWADAVVCVVASAFLASEWCPYEVGYARSRGSRLLPVLAEPGVDHPLVKSAHYADLTKGPAAGRTALVEALRRIDALGGWGWPDGRPPFPGLRPLGLIGGPESARTLRCRLLGGSGRGRAWRARWGSGAVPRNTSTAL